MLAYARANMLDVEMVITSLSGLDEDKEGADIILVGPQTRCALSSVRERVSLRVPVMAVDTRDYGMAKGEQILREAMNEIERYRNRLPR